MSNSATIQKYVQAMGQNFQAGKAGGLKATYHLQLAGDGGGSWAVGVADQKVSISQGAPPRADTTISMSVDNYLKVAAGQLQLVAAVQQGQIKVSGNTQLALKFAELFPAWASLVPAEPKPTPTPGPTPPPPAQPSQPPQPAAPTLADYVRAMPSGFRAGQAGGLKATYLFQISGTGGGSWQVVVANQTCTVLSQGTGSPINVEIRISDADFIRLAQGQLNTVEAFRQGRVKISGDLSLATKISEIFGPWANTVQKAPTSGTTPMTPTPTPSPKPTTPPTTQPTSQPTTGSVNPRLVNGGFNEYQPYVRKGEVKVWKDQDLPEQYGKGWTLKVIDEDEGRLHVMSSGIYGKFAQRYFGGGGLNYKREGEHSQVIASRYRYDLVFYQTVAAQSGRDYTFSGYLVTYYKGTKPPAVHDKIFYRVGIDPTGGQDYKSASIVWGPREGRDNEWRNPSIRTKAQANAITVFIRLENTEKDVGETELNLIHLDDFKLE
jgi:putative sterol carrier protein